MDLLKPYEPRARYVPKNNKDELAVQRQLCQYLRLHYPNVIFRSDFASGLHLTPYQARLHASLQSGRSFPDLTVLQPSRGFHGLFVEIKKEGTTLYLKTGKRKGLLTSDPHIQEQAAMLRHLNKLGYFARFGVGFDSCIKLIDWYLNPEYKQSENTELF